MASISYLPEEKEGTRPPNIFKTLAPPPKIPSFPSWGMPKLASFSLCYALTTFVTVVLSYIALAFIGGKIVETEETIALYFTAANLLPYLYATLWGRFRFWHKVANTTVSRGEYNLLDVGCSTGVVMLELARANEQATVVGVDRFRLWDSVPNSPKCLYRNALSTRLSTDRLIAHQLPDYTTLPFAHETFHLVTSHCGLSQTEWRGQNTRLTALKECIRVLRVGGRLVILEENPFYIRQYKKFLKEELGWKEVECYTVWNCWHKWIPPRAIEAIKPPGDMGDYYV